jgi:hypothetical protein
MSFGNVPVETAAAVTLSRFKNIYAGTAEYTPIFDAANGCGAPETPALSVFMIV